MIRGNDRDSLKSLNDVKQPSNAGVYGFHRLNGSRDDSGVTHHIAVSKIQTTEFIFT